MVDIATISAAFTGLTFARDALQFVLRTKVEVDTQTRVVEAVEKLSAAQDALFKMREEMFRLQGDNDRLRRELDGRDSWEAKKSAYRLQQAPGGAVVYQSEGPPKHFACPACFEKNTIQILQDRRVWTGLFDCPSCKAAYGVHPRPEQPRQSRATRSVSDDDRY